MQADKQIPLSELAVQEPPWQDPQESPTGAAGPQQKSNNSRALTEEIRQAGAETARRAREKGQEFLGQHKNTVAQTMHHCGDALRDAARKLDDNRDQGLASFTNIIADRIDRTSGYLESKQIDDIRGDLEQFARRQPFAFYGGMFAAGLALSRFFKASQSGAQEDFKQAEASDYEAEQQRREPGEAYGTNTLNPI